MGLNLSNLETVLQNKVDGLTSSSTDKDVLLTSKSIEAATADVTVSDIITEGATQTAAAATQATNAAASATTAATQASLATTNGAAQVALATTQAGIATTKAGEAATSKSGADTAKTAAESAKASSETAETNALSSKNSAATSASTATTQAGISSTKAGEASTSASAAATSASGAASAATTAVNAVIDTAPANLNTLNELAAALGDDANYAATTTTALGNRYTKAETDVKIVELSPPTDISGKFDKTGGTISGQTTITAGGNDGALYVNGGLQLDDGPGSAWHLGKGLNGASGSEFKLNYGTTTAIQVASDSTVRLGKTTTDDTIQTKAYASSNKKSLVIGRPALANRMELTYDSQGTENAYVSRYYNASALHFDMNGVDHMSISNVGDVYVKGSIKLGDDTRTAATAGAGAVRWNAGKLQNSTGSDWKDVSYVPLGSAQSDPAASAQAIEDAGDWQGDRLYWIDTPNGGVMRCWCVKDAMGTYMVVGKFAANAKDTVQSTISTSHTTVQDTSGTIFSCSFGDFDVSEVRFIGVNSIEGNWAVDRNIDFIHGIQSGRLWKNTFTDGLTSGQNRLNGALSTGAGTDYPNGDRQGYRCTYAKDGRGRWSNTNYRWHGMSDAACQVTEGAFTAAGSFYLNTAQDAKFTVSATRSQSGQDNYITAGFGVDDNVNLFYDGDTSEWLNNASAPGNVYSTAVYVLIR